MNDAIRPAVLVTGAAKRIGARIASTFGQAGWHVVVHYHGSADDAEALAAALPSAETAECDLLDPGSAVRMIGGLAEKLPDWRVLVNNASIFEYDTVTGLNPETYSSASTVNAQSPAVMAIAFLRAASARGGKRVIQVTDQKLANTNPDFFSYTMSKHAIDGAIRMLAKAQTDPRDRIYGLAPGAILASHDQAEDEIKRSHVLNLLGRKTGAEEIADAALFLSRGELASGETLYVDSGQHLLNQPRDVIYLAREVDPR